VVAAVASGYAQFDALYDNGCAHNNDGACEMAQVAVAVGVAVFGSVKTPVSKVN